MFPSQNEKDSRRKSGQTLQFLAVKETSQEPLIKCSSGRVLALFLRARRLPEPLWECSSGRLVALFLRARRLPELHSQSGSGTFPSQTNNDIFDIKKYICDYCKSKHFLYVPISRSIYCKSRGHKGYCLMASRQTGGGRGCWLLRKGITIADPSVISQRLYFLWR